MAPKVVVVSIRVVLLRNRLEVQRWFAEIPRVKDACREGEHRGFRRFHRQKDGKAERWRGTPQVHQCDIRTALGEQEELVVAAMQIEAPQRARGRVHEAPLRRLNRQRPRLLEQLQKEAPAVPMRREPVALELS